MAELMGELASPLSGINVKISNLVFSPNGRLLGYLCADRTLALVKVAVVS